MKTNKIKPIKKLMIFTIITVMIASLFAIPTFAVVNNVVWDAVSGNITPITVSPETASTTVNTDGYYCISIDADDITSAMNNMIGEFGAGIDFNILGRVANNLTLYKNGFVRLYYFDGGWIDYENYYDNGNDSYYTTLSYNGGTDLYEIGCPSRRGLTKYDLNDTIIKIDIIIPQYPVGNGLGNEQADAFWNNVVYSVYQYSNVTPDPDPEEPDDPTPPADGEEQGIFAVWSKITQWIVEGLASVSNAFYANGKLTLLGTLCIIPLALGLAFLLIGIIQKFLHLRG